MQQSHAQQIQILLGFIGVLILVIFVPLILSVIRSQKKNKNLQQTTTEVIAEKVTVEKITTIQDSLKKTNEHFFGRLKNAILNASSNSDLKSNKQKTLDEIEEILYTSDLGPKTVEKLLARVTNELSSSDMTNIEKIKTVLEQEMQKILFDIHLPQENFIHVSDILPKKNNSPVVLMIVGVNGAGKTTTIGKITAQLAGEGHKVLVAAGDTFRAAAGGQLKVWTDRAQAEIFWPDKVTDPASVAFDAVTKAKNQNFDYVILDTAGRLHTQSHLMEELKKVKRVMAKVIPEAPHETWIVLDANSGQNALNQAVEFNKAIEVSGIILTKMDGTAKGGVVLGVVDQLAKPIRLIGLGEKINDLQVFKPREYIQSILGTSV